MDGDRSRLGLDQHENHSRCSLLCYRDSDWNHPAMAGKGPHGPAAEARPGQLPGCPQTPTGVAFNKAILACEQ